MTGESNSPKGTADVRPASPSVEVSWQRHVLEAGPAKQHVVFWSVLAQLVHLLTS